MLIPLPKSHSLDSGRGLDSGGKPHSFTTTLHSLNQEPFREMQKRDIYTVTKFQDFRAHTQEPVGVALVPQDDPPPQPLSQTLFPRLWIKDQDSSFNWTGLLKTELL